MIKFEVGEKYSFDFIGDSDLEGIVEVLARTAKQLTFNYHGEIRKKKIHEWNNQESIFPCGMYSMAPICSAE